MKNKKHHLWYLVLGSVAVLLLVLLSLAKGRPNSQFAIIALFICVYMAWGVLHHIADKTLRLSVVLEYILIGSTAFFLLKAVLLK
ncbi:hypothetical protein A3D80_00055 [Candidatus Roizmanbacteria bacterium RIFCSPHIGHO2_02_FULL_40_13b]|uniref:Uncharacterized protein n=1 Tax=Candidatus Roizmanbacteria bacterium RIFCSPHIGHO2_01_FULL_39_24 TaxID=1802032 RepID=A0A1F7GJ19_9BACT|nr:MAG: hypothetical protein A2799_03825 [Candidatus Roizmanbacteria bacterium RIFCSPHIGHO2_01_FULL_39_24]OGK27779.1 MAG: hypothetical protein A3D80_00055 [Candidatus Roizmanbacteria bacterium RIFCSPHIGHO2_02_FULL_40_13b]OGK56400.1 MAG: hypothetical protein A3H83_01125 [Candidatus Roizmanbacteria bacterium RIFCSPLOWO2_02_FULL_39_8]